MATPSQIRFTLQFDPADIPALARRYNSKEDEAALAAGARIAAGRYAAEELGIIFKWKTRNRGVSRLQMNDAGEITDALRLAVLAGSERSAIAVLRGLSGVDTPVASAVMTAINPERYTVIDFRALEALGTDTPDRSLPFYLCYLQYCRGIAAQHDTSLRSLDRALWQWSFERSKAQPTAAAAVATTSKRSNLDPNAVIVAQPKNPHRVGTISYTEFAFYQPGMTVAAFITAKGSMQALRWHLRHGYIKLAYAS